MHIFFLDLSQSKGQFYHCSTVQMHLDFLITALNSECLDWTIVFLQSQIVLQRVISDNGTLIKRTSTLKQKCDLSDDTWFEFFCSFSNWLITAPATPFSTISDSRLPWLALEQMPQLCLVISIFHRIGNSSHKHFNIIFTTKKPYLLGDSSLQALE